MARNWDKVVQERTELKVRMEPVEAMTAKNELLLAAVTKKLGVQFVANPDLEKEISRLENRLREIQERRKQREREKREFEAAEEERVASEAAKNQTREAGTLRKNPGITAAEAAQKFVLETEGDSESTEEGERVVAEEGWAITETSRRMTAAETLGSSLSMPEKQEEEEAGKIVRRITMWPEKAIRPPAKFPNPPWSALEIAKLEEAKLCPR